MLMFSYFLDTENLQKLGDHEMIDEYREAKYHQLIVS